MPNQKECTCWQKENKTFDPSQDYEVVLGVNAKGFFVDICDWDGHVFPAIIALSIKSSIIE